MNVNPEIVCPALNDAVNTVLVAMAKAEILREEVAVIDRAILEEGDFRDEYSGERITDPEKSWRMSDASAEVYYPLRDQLIRERYDVEEDYCPALMAESDLRDATQVLIDQAEPFIGAGYNDFAAAMGKDIKIIEKVRDLLIKAVVSYPGYKAPVEALSA